MSTPNQQLDTGGGLTAAADYSTKQFHVVIIDATGRTVSTTADPTDAYAGVLNNAPASGGPATVITHGISPVICGGAVTRGDLLMVDAGDAGKVVPHDAADTKSSLGIALADGVDGEQIDAIIQPTPAL